MDLYSKLSAVLGLVALIALLKLLKRVNPQKSKGKSVFEIPGGLPIIGHMHLFREKKSLGRIFGAFADKYGPIFSVRLGIHRCVFISNLQAIKECFTVNDIAISSRPESTQARVIGYNGSSFAFAPYGHYWRNMRKLTALKLFSNARIKMLGFILNSELNYLMRDMYNLCTKSKNKIDIGEHIERMVLNIITRLVAGKRVFDGDNHVESVSGRSLSLILKELLDIAGQVVPGDVIPFIGWLDINGVVRTMKRITNEVSSIVDRWIKEHKLNNNKNEDQKDFIDVMLSEVTDDTTLGFDQATIIKGTAMTMIIGGADTTKISLVWILSNLLNRKALERCQEELDQKVGRNRRVQVEDVEKLEYLAAAIKESFRLYVPGPIATPKEVGEDCYISRYFIPKGTRLFMNVWKLQRDPNIWSNPEEFIPERFLTEKSHVDVIGSNFELLPFGAGRRACPEANFAMHVLSLTLATLLQGFNITTPNNEPVDMTEGQNIVMAKESPLEVILTPRLDASLLGLEDLLIRCIV